MRRSPNSPTGIGAAGGKVNNMYTELRRLLECPICTRPVMAPVFQCTLAVSCSLVRSFVDLRYSRFRFAVVATRFSRRCRRIVGVCAWPCHTASASLCTFGKYRLCGGLCEGEWREEGIFFESVFIRKLVGNIFVLTMPHGSRAFWIVCILSALQRAQTRRLLKYSLKQCVHVSHGTLCAPSPLSLYRGQAHRRSVC